MHSEACRLDIDDYIAETSRPSVERTTAGELEDPGSDGDAVAEVRGHP